MNTFPVTRSILNAKELGDYIISQYDLDNSTGCSLFRTGMNHTYMLTDNSTKHVLRLYCHNWRTKQEIEEEISLLLSLKEKGLDISHPVPDANGNYIQEINTPEGIRYAVVFSFAEGGKVRFIDEDTCFYIGTIMGKFHQATKSKTYKRINYNTEILTELPYQYANAYFHEDLPEMQYLKALGNDIKQLFKQIPLEQGVVHLDMWYENMAITNENEVTVFDFDFFGNGPLILDVAYFCKHLFIIEPNKEVYSKKVQAFINGYQSINPLSQQELNIIPHAAAAVFIFYLGVQSQRFDWSNIFLSENYLKMYVGRIQSWMKYQKY
ncbi:aminoglycoside phosphotransferase [Flavobacterium beibuense F44-8]|uniref:Aminoglycoside phosphotransferase n=1 Tax=Flavobacterium beibuense F44-8 TaxID=1406840 RepID=A0A0A2LWK4_9FLAO|nr:phosphotransferase [Flavobacterium beibuense]KGO84389.1 aminoglycoside phosphotransferase [Flavobacterium beibuense F44-8]